MLTTIAIGTLLLIALAIVGYLALKGGIIVKPPTTDKPSNIIETLWNGQTFYDVKNMPRIHKGPAIGFNIWGAAAYLNRPLYNSNNPVPRWLQYLDDANGGIVDGIQAKLFRLCVACADEIAESELFNNLETILDAMQARGQKALICFTSTGPALGLYHPSLKPFFGIDGARLHYSFYHSDYSALIAYMVRVTQQFSSHPAVFGWQLGNEWQLLPQPDAATKLNAVAVKMFFQRASEAVYVADPNHHPICLGLIDSAHVAPRDQQSGDAMMEWSRYLYGSLPYVEIVSNHIYPNPAKRYDALWDYETERLAVDANTSKVLGKAWMIDECGAYRLPTQNSGEHTHHVVYQMTEFLKRLPRYAVPVAVLQWGYSSETHDRGAGDNLYGFDPYLYGLNPWVGEGKVFSAVNHGDYPQ